MESVCAVVVTHNRLETLRRCLDAVAGQTRGPDRVVVVDNASTDGTPEMIERDHPRAELLRLPVNEGSSGGFHEGMKRAREGGADWLWLMDDDTIPEPAALAELLAAAERAPRRPALLGSKVVWQDGRLHPMNFPFPERSRVARAIDGAERELMPVRFATWVSLLVDGGAVERYGLPDKRFFIWSDDVEYTSRILLGGELGYIVPSSVALHDTASAHSPEEAAPDRFYFHVRNTLFMARDPDRDLRDRLVRAWVLVISSAQYVLERRSRAAVAAVARGVRDGWRRPG